MENDVMLNVEQVCSILGGEKKVSRGWVYTLVRDGRLRAIRYGSVKGIRIYKSSLDKFMKERKRDLAA